MELSRRTRRLSALALLLGAAALTTGCRGPRESLYATPGVVGETLLVRIADAHVKGDRVHVKAWLHNKGNTPVTVHRDALALRLADGRVLPGPQGGRAARPIVIKPGKAKVVKVAFDTGGDYVVDEAKLVLGSVYVQGEPDVRTLGEVALSSKQKPRAARPEARPIETAPSTPREPEPVDESDDGDQDEPEADEVEEAPEEDWEIGGKG